MYNCFNFLFFFLPLPNYLTIYDYIESFRFFLLTGDLLTAFTVYLKLFTIILRVIANHRPEYNKNSQ